MLECLRLSGSGLGDAVVRTYVLDWGVLRLPEQSA